jgi:PLP dependent protein
MLENNNNIEQYRQNYERICGLARRRAIECNRNPDEITVIAVSKTHGADVIANALEADIRVFGENYVQELEEKHRQLPEQLSALPQWHFIGHLQSNKVKYIMPYISMIHTVDSLHLAEEISRQAEKCGRTIDVLLQVNTSGEEQKSGCAPQDAGDLVPAVSAITHIRLSGLMTIGSFSDDEAIVRSEFRLLRSLRDEINSKQNDIVLKHLSMGMTGDFEIAVEEGATFVRVGTAIFGGRYYA